MLARIRNSFCYRAAAFALLALRGGLLASCATKQEAPIIADESTAQESALPWNKQEKWETQGQMGMAAERISGPGGRDY